MEYPYPYDQPTWNVNDQKYWCNMVNKYKYPITKVQPLYSYLIQQGKCATFEQEYNDYLATL